MQDKERDGIYNPTCAITGKTEKLRMYAHRNDNGDMIGWMFIHEDESPSQIEITITTNTK